MKVNDVDNQSISEITVIYVWILFMKNSTFKKLLIKRKYPQLPFVSPRHTISNQSCESFLHNPSN